MYELVGPDLLIDHMPQWVQAIGDIIYSIPWPFTPWVILVVAFVVSFILLGIGEFIYRKLWNCKGS